MVLLPKLTYAHILRSSGPNQLAVKRQEGYIYSSALIGSYHLSWMVGIPCRMHSMTDFVAWSVLHYNINQLTVTTRICVNCQFGNLILILSSDVSFGNLQLFKQAQNCLVKYISAPSLRLIHPYQIQCLIMSRCTLGL